MAKIPYDIYIISDAWKEKRAKFLEFYKYKCFKCGSKKFLNIHHLHYGTLGNETADDVILLCNWCHKKSHEFKRNFAHRPKEKHKDHPYNTQIPTNANICSICGKLESFKRPHLHNKISHSRISKSGCRMA